MDWTWGVRGKEVKVDAIVLAVTFRTCSSSAHWILPANLLPYLFYRWENRGIEKLSTSSGTPLVLSDGGTLWLSCVVPGSATLYTARCSSDHSCSKDSAVYHLEMRSLKGLPLVAGISRICVDEGISVFFFLTALVPPRPFPLWTCRWSWSPSLLPPLHPSRCARMLTLLLTCPLPLRVFTGCSDIMVSGSQCPINVK